MRVRYTSALTIAALIVCIAAIRTDAVSNVPAPVPLVRCTPPAAKLSAAPVRGSGRLKPAGQVRHFEKANLTVSAGTTTDGAIQVEAHGNNLGFRKKVQSNGHYTVDLETSKDKVSLAVTDTTIAITRGKKTITLSPDAAQNQFDDVRKLLADSRAVDLLRVAGAEFEASEDDSSASTPILLVDSLIGSLTGDVGASRRAARLLSRRARSDVRAAGRPNTCYYQWEQSIIWAYMDLEECFYSGYFFPTWCSLRWTMQAESAWFSFIVCSGFRF